MSISRWSQARRPLTRSQSYVPMPAASIARPQRTRSLSYWRTRAESSSSVTAESASWRSVAMSLSDQSRGAAPNTHSAPSTRPLIAVSGVPR